MEDEVLSLHDMGQEPKQSLFVKMVRSSVIREVFILPDMEFLANLRPFFTTLFGKKQSELIQ